MAVESNVIKLWKTTKHPELVERLGVISADLGHFDAETFAVQNHHRKSDFSTLWGTFAETLIWHNIVELALIHALAIYGFFTCDHWQHKTLILFSVIYGWAGGFGVTGGAHRLWCHKSYRAKLPLRIILVTCFAMSGQNRLYDWVRDHRVHHKFSETNADPHNSNRGFFFAHVGWLMMKKHPEVISRGREIDCKDVMADPVVAFFERHFWTIKSVVAFIFPILLPYFLWNETFYWSFMACMIRYVSLLNCTWLVNSAAHIFGTKPYDIRIQPADNPVVSLLSLGEGWHNYHHSFPWDYRAAELSGNRVNVTTVLIDFFAKIGWVYDRKQPSDELVKRVILNHGDGSHPDSHVT